MLFKLRARQVRSRRGTTSHARAVASRGAAAAANDAAVAAVQGNGATLVQPTVAAMEALSIQAGEATVTTVQTTSTLLEEDEDNVRPPFAAHDAKCGSITDLLAAATFDVLEVQYCTACRTEYSTPLPTPFMCGAFVVQVTTMALSALILPLALAIVASWYQTQFIKPWVAEQQGLSVSDVLYMPWNIWYRTIPADTQVVSPTIGHNRCSHCRPTSAALTHTVSGGVSLFRRPSTLQWRPTLCSSLSS